MWEERKVYKQLDKKEINPTFKKLGTAILAELYNYRIEQTQSVIKLFRETKQLEQSIFIEKDKGTYTLKVNTCIKPVDFYRRHKFTMSNIVPLGDIMNNYRRTFYPLTQEWKELAIFLAARIKNEIEQYFEKCNTYEKIIAGRESLEIKANQLNNTYGLLIYAAIKTNNKPLLLQYLDKAPRFPISTITQSEYLKPSDIEIDQTVFLQRIRTFAERGDFASIELEIAAKN
jgi:hypothetical protein